MQLKALLEADDAVSPVIGVILMVAITVILAAVIGSFVLGLGNQVSEAQPNPTMEFSYQNISDGSSTNDVVTLQHNGGDELDPENVNISIEGTTVYNGSQVNTYAGGTKSSLKDPADAGNGSFSAWTGSSISATDTVDIVENNALDSPVDVFANGDDVDLVWTGSSGDTAILAESEVS